MYAAAKDGESSGTAISMVKNVDTPGLGAAAEMHELISKIDSIEMSLHALNNKGLYKHRVYPQQTRPFDHNPHQFQNDRRSGQTSSQIPKVMILIDFRARGEVRQTLIIMKEEDFM